MPFWCSKASDADVEIAMDTLPKHHPLLSEYDVVIKSRGITLLRSSWKYLKRPFKAFYHCFKELNNVERSILIQALVLNIICGIYQTVDSYYEIYPGSKVAANILLNSKTSSVWNVFWAIFTYFTAMVDCGVVFLFYGMAASRIPRWLPFWVCLMVLGVPLIGGAPIYVKYLIRAKWNAVAFANACDGWDLDILVQGIGWTGFREGLPSVAWATIKTGGVLDYSMSLGRGAIDHEIYTLYLNDSSIVSPPYTSIIYNTSSTTYRIFNHTNQYSTSPLVFPSLNLVLRDDSIPFTRPSDNTYPPSADLIYRDGSTESNVLSTKVINLADCTMLRACGMRGRKREGEIALGVVLIEMFKASVYCTKPSNETVTL